MTKSPCNNGSVLHVQLIPIIYNTNTNTNSSKSVQSISKGLKQQLVACVRLSVRFCFSCAAVDFNLGCALLFKSVQDRNRSMKKIN